MFFGRHYRNLTTRRANLQKDPTIGVFPTVHNFWLKRNLQTYHSSEVEARQKEILDHRMSNPVIRWEATARSVRCTEEECVNPKYAEVIRYLQEHPETGTKPASVRFKVGEGPLREHMQRYHPLEIEKRRRTSNCTEQACDNNNYREAVTYLQNHPEDGIEPTAIRFNLFESALRSHVEKYHPLELAKRRITSDCTEQKCNHKVYRSAVERLKNYPKEGIAPTETRFGLTKNALRVHLAAYHPQLIEDRRKTFNCIETTCEHPTYREAVEHLRKHPEKSIDSVETFFKLGGGTLRRHVRKYHPQARHQKRNHENAQQRVKELILQCDPRIIGQNGVGFNNQIIADIIKEEQGLELSPSTIGIWRLGYDGRPSPLFGSSGEPDCRKQLPLLVRPRKGVNALQRVKELIMECDPRIITENPPGLNNQRIADIIKQELGVELSPSTIRTWRRGANGKPSPLFGIDGEPSCHEPWPSFEEARSIVRTKGPPAGVSTYATYHKAVKWRKKYNLPSSPEDVYADHGWKGWLDFFGKTSSYWRKPQNMQKAAARRANGWKCSVARCRNKIYPTGKAGRPRTKCDEHSY